MYALILALNQVNIPNSDVNGGTNLTIIDLDNC